MPSVPVSLRVAPAVHARLVELAEGRGRSVAGTASELLSAAVLDEEDRAPLSDGALVASVRELLADVTDPAAVFCREAALVLARSVERRDRGYVAACHELRETVAQAQRAQREADNPKRSRRNSLDALLAGLEEDYGL
ncbi:hypothetical protein [Kitasatospora sp. A2-31]|uniref:hypothetical protein n=1 Tax=Kitasatospora sp. A2-31 TaxID=2916414 RepID=UPI001EEB7AC1|nr:hypothetical protein [Kitasatospora sp. A2-31]MCG6496630.1 hypothetical protein [Kitasatospora sp. A2-31]